MNLDRNNVFMCDLTDFFQMIPDTIYNNLTDWLINGIDDVFFTRFIRNHCIVPPARCAKLDIKMHCSLGSRYCLCTYFRCLQEDHIDLYWCRDQQYISLFQAMPNLKESRNATAMNYDAISCGTLHFSSCITSHLALRFVYVCYIIMVFLL